MTLESVAIEPKVEQNMDQILKDDESITALKAHGTCEKPVQAWLKYDVER